MKHLKSLALLLILFAVTARAMDDEGAVYCRCTFVFSKRFVKNALGVCTAFILGRYMLQSNQPVTDSANPIYHCYAAYSNSDQCEVVCYDWQTGKWGDVTPVYFAYLCEPDEKRNHKNLRKRKKLK